MLTYSLQATYKYNNWIPLSPLKFWLYNNFIGKWRDSGVADLVGG